jgi:CheY-like chemotaxis protein
MRPVDDVLRPGNVRGTGGSTTSRNRLLRGAGLPLAPDVALLDFSLPGGINGCEVARRLLDMATDRLPLLIALTGYGREEDRRRSAESGMHLHLLKPVDPEYLNRLLERFKALIGK